MIQSGATFKVAEAEVEGADQGCDGGVYCRGTLKLLEKRIVGTEPIRPETATISVVCP